ncbi:hypothetical protein BB559_001213 [Furculomyces boomerangus]|uniref:Uncharacterized protein n=2 Tax=Harpellales TaxID=61421 RepID=A0A2T9Z2S1_9FUNG|nr:hypothetical protein BB559_001213 [Furculomyces boomerangus]PVZ99894.1 hypothetical protein BB558_004071 [Smittium angustum]
MNNFSSNSLQHSNNSFLFHFCENEIYISKPRYNRLKAKFEYIDYRIISTSNDLAVIKWVDSIGSNLDSGSIFALSKSGQLEMYTTDHSPEKNKWEKYHSFNCKKLKISYFFALYDVITRKKVIVCRFEQGLLGIFMYLDKWKLVNIFGFPKEKITRISQNKSSEIIFDHDHESGTSITQTCSDNHLLSASTDCGNLYIVKLNMSVSTESQSQDPKINIVIIEKFNINIDQPSIYTCFKNGIQISANASKLNIIENDGFGWKKNSIDIPITKSIVSCCIFSQKDSDEQITEFIIMATIDMKILVFKKSINNEKSMWSRQESVEYIIEISIKNVLKGDETVYDYIGMFCGALVSQNSRYLILKHQVFTLLKEANFPVVKSRIVSVKLPNLINNHNSSFYLNQVVNNPLRNINMSFLLSDILLDADTAENTDSLVMDLINIKSENNLTGDELIRYNGILINFCHNLRMENSDDIFFNYEDIKIILLSNYLYKLDEYMKSLDLELINDSLEYLKSIRFIFESWKTQFSEIDSDASISKNPCVEMFVVALIKIIDSIDYIIPEEESNNSMHKCPICSSDFLEIYNGLLIMCKNGHSFENVTFVSVPCIKPVNYSIYYQIYKIPVFYDNSDI